MLNLQPQSGLEAWQASLFARLALAGITREYPNHPGHVINHPADLRSPRDLHPAFYGCFDWHSAVHGHWMLARLLRLFPDLPEAGAIRAALGAHLTVENLAAEADYFRQPNRQSFERTYGWAWLLKLAQELRTWPDPDAAAWAAALAPLETVIVERYLAFLPRQTYPIRAGTHPNSAFGLAFALDYARSCARPDLETLIVARARGHFAGDADCPAAWEPGGADFLSPALCEADLMARILAAGEFSGWLARFLPGLANGQPAALLEPALVSDRSDPQLVHLDGLNLSRAWCMNRIASALPGDNPTKAVLLKSAARHAQAGLAQVASGEYAGEHWLASFAVYLLGG